MLAERGDRDRRAVGVEAAPDQAVRAYFSIA
jgi:hypothetical protein